MHYKTFNALTRTPNTLTDGQLAAEFITLRDRICAGSGSVVFLNHLLNLVIAEIVRRPKQ